MLRLLFFYIFERRFNSIVSIEQFSIMLYDMYQMDAEYPPLFSKNAERFKRVSYTQWAIDELKEYVCYIMFHRSEFDGSITDYIYAVTKFKEKMIRYYRLNERRGLQFKIAADVASSTLDILSAMQ